MVTRVLTNNTKCNHTGLYGMAIWKGPTLQISERASMLPHTYKVYVKVKFTLEEAMKTQRGNGGTSRGKMVGCQCHAPAALPQGKTWYPLYRSMGGPQGQSPNRNSIPGPSSPQRVAIPTELSRRQFIHAFPKSLFYKCRQHSTWPNSWPVIQVSPITTHRKSCTNTSGEEVDEWVKSGWRSNKTWLGWTRRFVGDNGAGWKERRHKKNSSEEVSANVKKKSQIRNLSVNNKNGGFPIPSTITRHPPMFPSRWKLSTVTVSSAKCALNQISIDSSC